jgi:CHAT domain-containing protein
VYDALGNRERALELYRDALALAAKIFDKQGEANALLHMGRTLTALDRPAEARRSLTKALEIVRASNRDETSVQLALGNSYMRSKSFSSAAESYRHVLALTEKSGDAAPRAEAQLALARIEMRRGRLRQALASLQAAQSIVETLRVRIANPEVRASYLTSRQAHYDLTIDVLMQLGRERDALDVSERARSRALLDALMIARVGDGRADPALLVREEAVRQRLNGKASALIRLQPKQRDGSEGRELRREIDALLAQYQQVRGDVARTEDDVNGRALPAKDIRSLLDADTLLIEYALGESRSYMWVVSRDSLDAFTLPPKADLDRLARRVIDLIPQSHKRDAAVQAEIASRRLSDALLRPAAHLLGKRRLAVVADGALQFVSFAALSDPSTPSQPLLVNHEIVALPSASLIAPLRRNRGRAVPQKIVAVLADPVLERGGTREVSTDLLRSSSPFANAFVRLPHTREEARRIAALVPSDQRMVAVDYDASRAVATSGQLENFRIVHFATHGFVHGEHPELSGLVLSLYDENGRSQDGFLRLSDIYRMRLSADLVVLSACRTALGKEVGREGLIGLTRGFISAGAPRVVASLWDVRDRATAELMERFYTHMLRDRMRPAAALRAAQLALQNDPRRSAPFYWAAFQLQGDWK